MKIGELKKALKESGCYIIREGANHEIWYSPKTSQQFPVGRHDSKEINPKTLHSIKKAAGLK
ncbi:MAG: type II toxin-antitoxin system HicA family toxin [Candidatus Fimivivens sp.]|nr:type II toxin-antitoxin system HicA family toxin [Candidatus Fimivivens sp.]